LSLKQYTPGEDFEVIVVDNGSSDEIHTHCPIVGQNLFGQQFRYIRLERNINFGPACNLGAKKSQGHFLFFLNNDTLVTENWLPPLLNASDEDKNLGAVGPLLLYPDNTVQHLGVTCSPVREVFHLYGYFPASHPVVRKRRKFQVITGAAFFIPRKLFFECDGFYELYKNGFEDVDLCVQIIAKDKKITVIPESIVFHLTSQTPGRHQYEDQNSFLFTRRYRRKLVPDMHRYYLEDGYDFELTYFLNILPKLSEEKLKILYQDKSDGFDYDWYMQKLAMELFWWQGYKELWNYWVKAEAWENAAEVVFRAIQFFPVEVLLTKLEFLIKKIQIELLREKGVHPPVAGNHQFQPYFRDRRKRLSPPRKHICDKSILTADDYPATSGCTREKVYQIKSILNKNRTLV
jgi:GT2 family glycosyltransferase